MLSWITGKIFGSHNEAELRRLRPLAEQITGLEPEISRLSEEQLRAKTAQFQQRIEEYIASRATGTADDAERRRLEKEALNILLPEAFAVCREAAKRSIGMRHFDVQLIGGIVLYEGKIAEMSTGEGKTLVATLPIYLNALLGRGTHLITVNDYLAQRDCGWMGPVYHFLGLSCASISHDFSLRYDPSYTDASARDDRMAHLRPVTRREAYRCDLTCGTNNEFGFDYLRDNMVIRREDMVQRELFYAIVDEVDSILIDEARTPLIISGPADMSTDKYYQVDKIIPRLACGKKDENTKEESGDYIVDEKGNTAYLTDAGEAKVSAMLGVDSLSDLETSELRHHVLQALKAHTLFRRDVDYVVKDGEVIIVDEFTGRLMPGRRWSDGLHQAVEAKEGVKIERENQTLATITFQNLFRIYKTLAGMTGTALTEEAEFRHIYKLDVIVVPTNRPLIRTNHPDVIYKTEREKFNAVVEEIISLHEQGRPVLVGTVSIEKSERLSRLLKSRGIIHQVLNAKYHELEAPIIAQAGRRGSVTIATNMAGRGTDILLGGNAEYFANELLRKKGVDPQIASAEQKQKALQSVREEFAREHETVVKAGGLHIIGTERHEARRIDNQLRGRAGRQGDPGSSRFFLSLEDDLMRIFASDRIAKFMNFFQWEEGLPIEHPMITKSIEIAQKRVEAHNFDIRKHLLEYDNVMNKQREILYEQRRMILEQDSLKDYLRDLMRETAAEAIERFMPPKAHPADWNTAGLEEWAHARFGIFFETGTDTDASERLPEAMEAAYAEKSRALGGEMLRGLERTLALHILDSQWKDHLYAVDKLREGIGLRAFGQRDPLVEYQHEAYRLFVEMIRRIKEETLEFLFKIKSVEKTESTGVFEAIPMSFSHPQTTQYAQSSGPPAAPPQPEPDKSAPFVRAAQKVGRNDPCPCGSGKKYKKCCGA